MIPPDPTAGAVKHDERAREVCGEQRRLTPEELEAWCREHPDRLVRPRRLPPRILEWRPSGIEDMGTARRKLRERRNR